MLIEFCVPVYNEEKILKENILKLLDFLESQNFNFKCQIIIAVNGSTDNSYNIGKELANKKSREIRTVNYNESGKGYALKKYCAESGADVLIYMDVDLAASLDNITDLLKPIIIDHYDLVIGSRLLPESKINRSFIRELSSQGYNFLSRLVLGHKFSDMQCGFKAIKINTFKKILPFINDDQWFFDTELVTLADYFGFKVKEIPINWSEERYDRRKSKINIIRDSIKFTINLIKFRRRLNKIKK